ncbi:MAG: PEP-CTERM sorting domain-containing protein [Spartobacteria bacterium]
MPDFFALLDMKRNISRRTRPKGPVRITSGRWAAYATAGAATALAYTNTAEAVIHHFDVNEVFNAQNVPGTYVIKAFNLEPGAYLTFLHATGPLGGGFAGFYFGTLGALSAKFLGVTGTLNGNPYHYVSKLGLGQSIANQTNFLANIPGKFDALASGYGYPNSQWVAPGTGFIGFRFDVGDGTQYGWARLEMDGAKLNSYTFVDYAFADPGQTLRTGQVPESGSSLGMLALGAAGLLALRRQFAKAGV